MDAKGTYIFFARLDSDRDIHINKAGHARQCPKGWYAYVGSAFGPGGLKSRLNRHFLKNGKAHWNIDFFRQAVKPHPKAWVSFQSRKLEPLWSSVFQVMPGVSMPIANFGNADARSDSSHTRKAPTHLFHFKRRPRLDVFQSLLDARLSEGEPVREVSLPLP